MLLNVDQGRVPSTRQLPDQAIEGLGSAEAKLVPVLRVPIGLPRGVDLARCVLQPAQLVPDSGSIRVELQQCGERFAGRVRLPGSLVPLVGLP